MKKTSTYLVLTSLLLWTLAPAFADDSDIFVATRVDPNVVILLDSSGSMNSEIHGQDKIAIAKSVLKDLLRNNDDIRFGIFKFTDAADGGELISELGSPLTSAISAIDDVDARGGTPLGLATLDVKEYYAGEFVGCLEESEEEEEEEEGLPTYRCRDCDECKECTGSDCAECDCKDCDSPIDELEKGLCLNCVCDEWKNGDEGKDCECDCFDPIDLRSQGATYACLDCKECKDCTGNDCNDCECKECDWPLDEFKDGVCIDCDCDKWKDGEGEDCACQCYDPSGSVAQGPTYSCRDCKECKDCTGNDCTECTCDDCDAPVFEIDKEVCTGCTCDEWKNPFQGKQCDCECFDPYWSGVSGSGDDTDVLERCDPPIESHCQSSFAILVTDGLPTTDNYTDQVVDAARSLYTGDFADFDGVQNVVVHTVGFDIPAGKTLLTRAATAGGGNFYTADDAAQLQTALEAALAAINEASYSFTNPQIPSTGVDGGDKAYIASFKPSNGKAFWRGQLKAYTKTGAGLIPLDADGLPLDSAVAWDAGALLAAKSASTRKIYTVKSGNREVFATSNNAITPALLGVAGKGEADALIDYVRGIDTYDHDRDTDVTEERDWKLGDIYHSSPTLVFPPPLRSNDSSYQTFKSTHASRTTILLAGANDGMLHAFQESDGQELWGFIPPDLLDQLRLLPESSDTHPFYVDGSPMVADVKTGGAWKTIVLFGERRGGGGYHALDITDTADPAYLWSFTDSKIAESWSEPVIGKIRMADNTDKWVAFMGGGYDTADNNAHGAAFFVIDLANGNVLWQYYDTGSNDDAYMNYSIVASPRAVDLSRDGYVDHVYVGDVGGQLWKFDVSAKATLSGGKVSNWSGMRLFVADGSQANPPAAGDFTPTQAMYATPTVVLDRQGETWVAIGTGDRNNPLESLDNRFYAIKDDRGMGNNQALTESDLVSALTTDTPVHGWYLPLATSEKVLSKAEIFDSIVYFSTFAVESAEQCEPAVSARLYAVKMDSGHAALNWGDGSHLASTDGSEDRSKVIGEGIPSGPEVSLENGVASVVVSTTAEEISVDSFASPAQKRLRYWREVF